MKQRGFTLVELLAVVLILTGLMLIIIPLMTMQLKKGQEIVNQQNKDSIVLASKNWGSDNKKLLPKNNTKICISVKNLMDEGYLDNTSETHKDNSVVITNDNGAYYYNFQNKSCLKNIELYKTVTFNYKTSDGNEKNKKISVIPGKQVNLTVSELDNNSTFVGWNTNKKADKGLETYTMPSKDVTLYAIYNEN